MKISAAPVSCFVLAFILSTSATIGVAEDKTSPTKSSVAAAGAAKVKTGVVPPAWIAAEGTRLAKSNPPTLASVRALAQQKLVASGTSPTPDDIDALMQQVLQRASEQAAVELQQVQTDLKAAADKKKAQRDAQQKMKDAKDSLSDLSQQDQMKLQQAMDRKSKLEQMLSNVMKKTSDTSQALTGNLK